MQGCSFGLALQQREQGVNVDVRERRWTLGKPSPRPLELPRGAARVSMRELDARGRRMDQPSNAARFLAIDGC